MLSIHETTFAWLLLDLLAKSTLLLVATLLTVRLLGQQKTTQGSGGQSWMLAGLDFNQRKVSTL